MMTDLTRLVLMWPLLTRKEIKWLRTRVHRTPAAAVDRSESGNDCLCRGYTRYLESNEQECL